MNRRRANKDLITAWVKEINLYSNCHRKKNLLGSISGKRSPSGGPEGKLTLGVTLEVGGQ